MNTLSDVALIEKIASIEGELAMLRAESYVRAGIPLPSECAHVARIVQFAAVAFSVAETTIYGPTRHGRVCQARFAIMWVAREAYGYGSVIIGRALGNRDHSTVLHGQARAEQLRDQDEDFREVTDRLLALVTPKSPQENADAART